MSKKDKIICWLIAFRPVLIVVVSVITYLVINHLAITIWRTDRLLFEGDYIWTTIFQLFFLLVAMVFVALIFAIGCGLVYVIFSAYGKMHEWSTTRYQNAWKIRQKKKNSKNGG